MSETIQLAGPWVGVVAGGVLAAGSLPGRRPVAARGGAGGATGKTAG